MKLPKLESRVVLLRACASIACGNRKAFAEKLGVHETALHRWLSGRRRVPEYIRAHAETLLELWRRDPEHEQEQYRGQ